MNKLLEPYEPPALSDETIKDIRTEEEPGNRPKPNKAMSAKMLRILALMGASMARGISELNKVMATGKPEPVAPRVAAWKKKKRKMEKLSRRRNR